MKQTENDQQCIYSIENYHHIHQILQPLFLQGIDLGFVKILHIFYNLMLNRSFDAMFWRIYSVCWSVHHLKLTSDVLTLGTNNSVNPTATDKIKVLKQPKNELFFTCRIRPLSSCFIVLINGGGRVVRRCCVSYITGASNWYWLTVGQGLLSL